jgi:hypothetical protein
MDSNNNRTGIFTGVLQFSRVHAFFGLRGYRGYIYEDIDDKGVQRHIKTNGDKKHCVESRKGRSRTKQCKRDYGSKKWHKGIMHHKAVRSGTKA